MCRHAFLHQTKLRPLWIDIPNCDHYLILCIYMHMGLWVTNMSQIHLWDYCTLQIFSIWNRRTKKVRNCYLNIKKVAKSYTKYEDIKFQLIFIWLGIEATNRKISGLSMIPVRSGSISWWFKTWRNLAMFGSTISRQWRCNNGTFDKTLPFWTSRPSGLRSLYGFPVVGSISTWGICFHLLWTNQPYL